MPGPTNVASTAWVLPSIVPLKTKSPKVKENGPETARWPMPAAAAMLAVAARRAAFRLRLGCLRLAETAVSAPWSCAVVSMWPMAAEDRRVRGSRGSLMTRALGMLTSGCCGLMMAWRGLEGKGNPGQGGVGSASVHRESDGGAQQHEPSGIELPAEQHECTEHDKGEG